MAKINPRNRRILVRVKDYNGYKGILFAFRPDDERISANPPAWATAGVTADNYSDRVGEGTVTERGKVLTLDDGRIFTVHADWSVTEGHVRPRTMAEHRAMEGNPR